MQDTPALPALSEAKRALLERYRQGTLVAEPARQAAISRRAPDAIVPLSYGQQQLWLVDHLVPEAPVYNECVTIHLPGPLDVAVFERAFNEIVRRHEIWRTTFPTIDGQPVQHVHPDSARTLPLVDLMALPAEDREAESVRLATIEARQPFDLAAGPLLRATLMRLGEQDHRLYLALHHIIFDGVAMYQGFLPELRSIYEAFLDGRPSPLPEPPIQYADYAVWQREDIQGETLERHLAYWRQRLGGRLPVLQLPTDRPRPATETFRGSMLPFALSRELTSALDRLARREGCTLYMVLLAAYTTLLHRYSGQEDILIGTATAGRNRPELRAMIGYFLTTMVMRTDPSGTPTFSELLRRVREVTLEGMAHDDVPFDILVRTLQPERTLTHNPLFQTLLTLEPPLPVLECGWTLTQMDVETGISKFDLSLEMDNRPEGLIGRFEYNSDLFDRATIERMNGQWRTLLESIVADPGRPISALPLLPAAERRQLLEGWNDTAREYPRQATVHQLVEEQARRTPHAIAAVCADEHLTYGALNRRANQLAHHLRTVGVGPETLVGICVDHSLEMLVGLLGILKAGGAYVPLDPTFPSDRIAFMLDDARAPVLVASRRTAAALPPHDARLVLLDVDWPEIARQEEANPDGGAGPANLAYVIYTSGSTGWPKGVQVPHRAVVNLLCSMAREPGLSAEDRLLAVTTLSFDIAGLELFLPLTVGARVVVVNREVAINGPALIDALTASGATVMQATPATWQLLLAAGWRGDSRLTVLCGGEGLPRELAAQLLPRVGSLWNMYGPTETTIWSAVCKVERADTISIGHPIANTRLYVLDTHGQLLPIGVPGELHIGGDGLARGYLGRPELTAERFIPHPLRDEPGERLYRTGDLVRYRMDGTLEFLGRLDTQVKVRGYRIELGEVEAALAQQPGVQAAVVVAREDRPGDRQLVAYVVASPEGQGQGAPATIETLALALRGRLPAYMVPAAFVLLDALPLTPNGKTDRRALPSPAGRPDEPARRGYVAPRTPLERALARIWEDVLDIGPVGVRDNFFDLGGHSLLAVRLLDRIQRVCGRAVPLSILFGGATVERLAAALEDGGDARQQAAVPLVEVQGGGSGRPFYFLHGDMYGGYYCLKIARRLGDDRPFYALPPHGLDGWQVARTVEAIASYHVGVLRAFQPRGPYLLGGFCNGGVIAYEMARQLQAEGQQVDRLVIVDAAATTTRYAFLDRPVEIIGRPVGWDARRRASMSLGLHYHVARWYDALRLGRRDQVLLALQTGRRAARRVRAVAVRRDAAVSAATLEARGRALLKDYWMARRRYTPRPYDGDVVLLWPADYKTAHGADATQGWAAVARRVDVRIIPGTHETCTTTHIDALADRLRACLDEADSGLGKS